MLALHTGAGGAYNNARSNNAPADNALNNVTLSASVAAIRQRRGIILFTHLRRAGGASSSCSSSLYSLKSLLSLFPSLHDWTNYSAILESMSMNIFLTFAFELGNKGRCSKSTY